jgi:hypothetical protein
MTSPQKIIWGAALAAAVGIGIYEGRQAVRLSESNRKLAVEIQQLARERDDAVRRLPVKPAPHLPAPHLPAASASASPLPEDSPSTNHLLSLATNAPPKLTNEQIEAFLKANHRNAASLLAMARLTGDKSFLKEAMEKYPNDPRVAFDAVRMSDTPEERRQWLEKFKQNAPDNALAGYLSALDYFRSGQTDQAVQELMAASGKSRFQDYSWDYIQDAEEAWRSAGYTEAETRMLAAWQLKVPHLRELRYLDQSIGDLANAYRQAGDDTSAQAALAYSWQLGERLAEFSNDPLISQLVGLTIQRNALGALDPNSLYGTTGQTVAELLQQLQQQRAAVKVLTDETVPFHQTMSPQDWITYMDRMRAFGELSAMEWLINKSTPDGQLPLVNLTLPLTAYLAANKFQPPTDPSQLLPFATTPEEQTALRQLMKNFPGMSEDEKAALQSRIAEFQAGAKGVVFAPSLPPPKPRP